MSYTPTEWADGDVITAEKLNNIESGISEAEGGSGGILIINETEVDDSHGNGLILDKTWQEIFDAIYEDHTPCYIFFEETVTDNHNTYLNIITEVFSLVNTGQYPSTQYSVTTLSNQYSATSADDYPFQPFD